MVMVGYGLDRGGPKDSENAPNSFFTKINEKGFLLFVPDIYYIHMHSFIACKDGLGAL